MKHGNAWKGGRYIRSDGYMMIYIPEHLRAHNNYVREHIVIAEKALGKPLPPGVEIHHHGKRDDNTQIVICQDHAYHFLLHQRTRALKACGHVTWRKCSYCKKYDKPDNLYINKHNAFHRSCSVKYTRKRRVERRLDGLLIS